MIRNRENTGIKYLNDSRAFIECSNTMNDVFENIDDYNPNRKIKILIVFDDMIADVENHIFLLYLSLSLIFLFQKM